jgi:Domain of unknown function (DUF4114)
MRVRFWVDFDPDTKPLHMKENDAPEMTIGVVGVDLGPSESSACTGILLGSCILNALIQWFEVSEGEILEPDIRAVIHDAAHLIQHLEAPLYLSLRLWEEEMGEPEQLYNFQVDKFRKVLRRSPGFLQDHLGQDPSWDRQQILQYSIDLCLQHQWTFATIEDSIPAEILAAGVEVISLVSLTQSQADLEMLWNLVTDNAAFQEVIRRPTSLTWLAWLLGLALICAVLNADEVVEVTLERVMQTSPLVWLLLRKSTPSELDQATFDQAPEVIPIAMAREIALLQQTIVDLLQAIVHQAVDGDRKKLTVDLAIQAVIWSIISAPKAVFATEFLDDITQLSWGGPLRGVALNSTKLDAAMHDQSLSTLSDEKSTPVSISAFFQKVIKHGRAIDILKQQTGLTQSQVFTLDLLQTQKQKFAMPQQAIAFSHKDSHKDSHNDSHNDFSHLVTLLSVDRSSKDGMFNDVIADESAQVFLGSSSYQREDSSQVDPAMTPAMTPVDTIFQDGKETTSNPEPNAQMVVTPVPDPIVNPTENPVKLPKDPVQPTSIWSTFTSGIYTVDTQGEISIDYLWDGGANEGEVGIFDLSGMETLINHPTAFTEEVIRRVLSNSRLGHVVLSDVTEGARFSGKLITEPENFNSGTYTGIKSFDMKPGSQFGVIMISEGQFKNLGKLSNTDGFFFSLTKTTGSELFRSEQMMVRSTDRSILQIEDVPITTKRSDRDYNDLIFNITGANGMVRSSQSLTQNPFRPDQFLRNNALEVTDRNQL